MKTSAVCFRGNKNKERMMKKVIKRASEKKEIIFEEKAVNFVTSNSEWISLVQWKLNEVKAFKNLTGVCDQ